MHGRTARASTELESSWPFERHKRTETWVIIIIIIIIIIIVCHKYGTLQTLNCDCQNADDHESRPEHRLPKGEGEILYLSIPDWSEFYLRNV